MGSYLLHGLALLATVAAIAWTTSSVLPPRLSMRLPDWVHQRNMTAFLALMLVPLVGSLASAPLRPRSPLRLYAGLVGILCGGVLMFTAPMSDAKPFPLYFSRLYGDRLWTQALIPSAILGVVSITSFWCAWALFCLPIVLGRSSGALKSIARQRKTWLELGWTAAVLVVAALATPWGSKWVVTPGIFLLFCSPVVIMLWITFALLRDHFSTPAQIRESAGCAAVIAIPAAAVALFAWGITKVGEWLGPLLAKLDPPWLEDFLNLLFTVPFVFIIGATVVAAVGMGIFAWAKMLYWQIRYLTTQRTKAPRSITAHDWLKAVRYGNPYLQAVYLDAVTKEQVGLATREELLTLIEKCELDIVTEPAQSVYWQRRRALEEELRQGEAGHLSDPSATSGART
jgi:hypothetical protein